jgi:catechol 2,3-dioxygenase-like lactoylglutathione lyase family enzyme
VQSRVGHVLFNVRAENLPFYRDLLSALGWNTIFEGAPEAGAPMLGMGEAGGASLWFSGEISGADDAHAGANHYYDGQGVNHLAFAVEAQADVDTAARCLAGKGVAALFETPRHRPEFSGSETETYYQVMFASPDGVLFEVVYTGPKSA